MTARLRIAAVVVSYNRLPDLQQTVARLLAEDLDHVLVVDNASSDGTDDWLATQGDPRLAHLRLPDNRGGAGGFEAGMAAVTAAHDPDWTVLMDDDARPVAGAIAAFRAGRFGGEGVIAAAVTYPDGGICEMNRPSQNPFWHGRVLLGALRGGRGGFHVTDADYAAAAGPRPIDIASFVGFFVHRTAVQRGGLPEGGLFLYGDDVLYSLRLRRAGVTCAFWPAVRFEHDCATMGSGLIYRPIWKAYYHCRNGVAISRQAAGPLLFPFALGYYLIAWARKAKHYGGTERPVYRRLMWMGVRDGLLGRRGRNDAAHRIATLGAAGAKG